jgi:hypothetical protein
LIALLTLKEIERNGILVSKFKEDAIDHRDTRTVKYFSYFLHIFLICISKDVEETRKRG